MADGASEAPTLPPGPQTGPGPDILTVPVDVGRRALVVANLGLTPQAGPATTWASSGLARVLDGWEGPGLVVVAGNLLDLSAETDSSSAATAALAAHPRLAKALETFACSDDRRVICIPGTTDAALGSDAASTLTRIGVEVAAGVALHMATAAGTRVVRVEAGVPSPVTPTATTTLNGNGSSRGSKRTTFTLAPDPDAEWQEGLERLADPASTPRFLTSRLLYRRFARFAWWLLVPFAIAIALRLPVVSSALDHLVFGHPTPSRAIQRAHAAAWGARLFFAAAVCIGEIVILAVALGFVARKAWRTLGGGDLDGPFHDALAQGGATANDDVRDAARALCAEGSAGVVSGATLQAELTHLGSGFFACPGAAGEVVEEHHGRLGLLPVFLACQQLAWVELETGAELHARLLLTRSELPGGTVLERLAARDRKVHETHPSVVAAYPHGASWPPAPDLGAVRNRSRRVRRWAAGAIAVAGVIDVLSAVTPPVRGRLHVVLELLPYVASQAAGALVALVGIGLLALARGVRRGQRRAFVIAVWAIGISVFLHLARGGDIAGSVFAVVVLGFLVLNRKEFPAASDRPSLRSAAIALVGGVLGITIVTTALVEITLRFDLDRPRLPLWRAGQAVLERLVGLRGVEPPRPARRLLVPGPSRHGGDPGRRGRAVGHATPGGPSPLGRPCRRNPGPRHRPPPRSRHPRLLRPTQRQAVVLPP